MHPIHFEIKESGILAAIENDCSWGLVTAIALHANPYGDMWATTRPTSHYKGFGKLNDELGKSHTTVVNQRKWLWRHGIIRRRSAAEIRAMYTDDIVKMNPLINKPPDKADVWTITGVWHQCESGLNPDKKDSAGNSRECACRTYTNREAGFIFYVGHGDLDKQLSDHGLLEPDDGESEEDEIPEEEDLEESDVQNLDISDVQNLDTGPSDSHVQNLDTNLPLILESNSSIESLSSPSTDDEGKGTTEASSETDEGHEPYWDVIVGCTQFDDDDSSLRSIIGKMKRESESTDLTSTSYRELFNTIKNISRYPHRLTKQQGLAVHYATLACYKAGYDAAGVSAWCNSAINGGGWKPQMITPKSIREHIGREFSSGGGSGPSRTGNVAKESNTDDLKARIKQQRGGQDA